jgi:hypothetical protein
MSKPEEHENKKPPTLPQAAIGAFALLQHLPQEEQRRALQACAILLGIDNMEFVDYGDATDEGGDEGAA